MTKFAPLALGPVLAMHPRRARLTAFLLAFLATVLVVCAPLVLNGEDLSTVWDRTIGFQSARGSPFSVWGYPGGLGARPSTCGRRSPRSSRWRWRSSRAGATSQAWPRCARAILIALQLGVTHWFYLYIAWFFPLVMLCAARTSTCSIAAARGGCGAQRDDDGVEPGVVLGGLEADAHVGAQRLDRLLLAHADDAAARAGHADVGDVGGAAGQHARVGRRDVGVRADDRGDAAVEVPAHRDLLARRLGMEVDEHVVGLAAQLLEDLRRSRGTRRAPRAGTRCR